MKIYYYKQGINSNIEFEESTEIAPKKNESVGTHLAYAITSLVDRQQELIEDNASKEEIRNALLELFREKMNETPFTANMLKTDPLPDDFDFTNDNLERILARHYTFDSLACATRSPQLSFRERASGWAFTRALKTVTKTATASVLSVLKTFAGAGQALFGGKKILKHVVEDLGLPIPDIGKRIFLGLIIFGASNTNVLTRASTIFRKIFSPSNYLRLLRITTAPNTVTVEAIVIPEPTQNAANDLVNEAKAEASPEPPVVPAYEPSALRRAAHHSIMAAVYIGPYSSSIFTSVNAILGGQNVLEYITNTDMEDPTKLPSDQLKLFIQIGAFLIAIANFYSSFTYNLSAAQRNGKRLADWATNIDGTYKHRLRDIWNYRWALLITFPNVWFSELAYAFFATRFSLPTVPYVTKIFSNDTILKITAFSTATAFIQNILTTIPATQELLQPTPDIKAALDRLPPRGKNLLRYGRSVGFLDSSMTGLSYYVAIGDTINKVSNHNISKTNPYVLMSAVICGAIKVVTNQGFSVDPGVISLLRDIYPEIFAEEKLKFEQSQRAAQPAQPLRAAEVVIEIQPVRVLKKYKKIQSHTLKLPLLPDDFIYDDEQQSLTNGLHELKPNDPFSQSTPNLNALNDPSDSTSLVMNHLDLNIPKSNSSKNLTKIHNFDGIEEKEHPPTTRKSKRPPPTFISASSSAPLPSSLPIRRSALYLPAESKHIVVAASSSHRNYLHQRKKATKIDDRTSSIEAAILQVGMGP